MKNFLEENTCITEKNLEPSSLASSEDKCQEKDDGVIDMENNLVNHTEGESERPTVQVNFEIVEEEKELAKSAGSSIYKNIDDSDEEICLTKKGGKARVINSEDENFEDSSRSNKENIQESYHNEEITAKFKTSKKKSKNQIREERLKIHSETHRLMREREIPIPYHLPKQRTLREFLSRKKNRANIPLNTPSFKMVEIWKDIEESTKTASEFFKSDSDSECELTRKEIKSKKYKEKNQERQNKFLACDTISNGKNNNNIENNADCNFISDKQDNCQINDNTENSVPSHETLRTGKNYTGKENEKNVAVDIQEENAESLLCKLVGDTIIEQNNSANTFENSNQCIDNEISQNVNESNSDENYTRMKTLEWVKNIPVYEKLLKQNKKEMLLKKIDPTILKITPKLSGESDSVIDLENITNDIEIGAKKLKKRFFKNCLLPRQNLKNEVQLTITTCENDEMGGINNVTTEKLVYNSTSTFDNTKYEKPGAKLQRLREELQKKIEEKWECKRQAMEEEFEECTKEEEMIENEEELLEYLEDVDEIETCNVESEDDDDIEEEDDDSVDVKPRGKLKNNIYIQNEAEESGCEESGNEGSDELDEEQDESEDEDDSDIGSDNDNSNVRATVKEKSADHKSITSLLSEEIFEKDSNLINAYNTQSSEIPPYQPGGGMLNGGSELSQYDDDNSIPKNILSPTLKLSMYLSPDRKNTASQQSCDLDLELPEVNSNRTSFVPRFPENENFDLNEAYEFCSGKFPDNAEQNQGAIVDSQGSLSSESNNLGLNSGVISAEKTFHFENNNSEENEEANYGEKKMSSRIKLISDDSEEETGIQDTNVNELEHITGKRISDCDSGTEKSFILKNKRTKKHLRFSDEEENSENELENDAPSSGDELHEEEEVELSEDGSECKDDVFEEDPVRTVEYNSEEEEIVNPREFFEKEAELSGSEWSGDEDERGLDKMEEEVGDDDKLDNRKVRSQLEKIHMRTLLDDDARQVRILQELLFEDGDLFDDGPKRERNFKWKNLGAFFNEDGNTGGANTSNDQEQVEEDEQSTKLRHEKELFLLNLKTKKEESGLEEDENKTISLLKVGKVVLQQSVKSKNVHEEKVVRKNNGDIDNIGFKPPVALSKKRGSFLLRNEEFLSRLAKFTSNATDNILGPKHSINFVFASKSPEKTNHSGKENSESKRKDVSSESGYQAKKKAKLYNGITHQEPSVLDRLI